jgi:1-acyl-sn-glycerol-3-phosphate acyltransferase
MEVEVHGLEHVREAVGEGKGVLITPNHSSHADCFSVYSAAEALGFPFYVMVAWQVFARGNRLRRLVLRHHGCFSIDREGTDRSAVRQARDVLMSGAYPLVIFPEGEVYHINDRVMPFREGPAAIALMAAKKADRPIVCIPSAIKYSYLTDPTPELTELMGRLEQALLWRPRPDLDLPQRIYHLAEGVLALKEIEYLGETHSGPLPERIRNLIEFALGRVEARHGLDPGGATIPERVKAIRQAAVEGLSNLEAEDPARRQFEEELDDAFFAVQAFSYPGDYVAEEPTVERIAETLDKFEEDILGVTTATIRGTRKASVTFGEPIPVTTDKRARITPAELTRRLEEQVQGLLASFQAGG